MRKIAMAAILLIGIASVPAHAWDSWPCEVVLCMANPDGPTAAASCLPPIEKLVEGDAKGKTSGSYRGHMDGKRAGHITNWKTNYDQDWKAGKSLEQVSAEDRARLAAEAATRKAQEAKLRAQQAEIVSAAVDALTWLQASRPQTIIHTSPVRACRPTARLSIRSALSQWCQVTPNRSSGAKRAIS